MKKIFQYACMNQKDENEIMKEKVVVVHAFLFLTGEPRGTQGISGEFTLGELRGTEGNSGELR